MCCSSLNPLFLSFCIANSLHSLLLRKWTGKTQPQGTLRSAVPQNEKIRRDPAWIPGEAVVTDLSYVPHVQHLEVKKKDHVVNCFSNWKLPSIKLIYSMFPECIFYFPLFQLHLFLSSLLAGITFPIFLLSQSPSILQNPYPVLSCPKSLRKSPRPPHPTQGKGEASRIASSGLSKGQPLSSTIGCGVEVFRNHPASQGQSGNRWGCQRRGEAGTEFK